MRILFRAFALDRATRQLHRGAELRPLEPKAYELLELLISRRPAAVSKQEIRDRLWPDSYVSESTLSSLVAQVRRALRDPDAPAEAVRTVHRFGYAFAAAASEERQAGPRGVAGRIAWEGRVALLAPGENLLGRGDEADVSIDVAGVSRRHARITITGRAATLEDLGSKNGTFVGERRLDAPSPLRDGAEFRLGRLKLVFRAGAGARSTLTET